MPQRRRSGCVNWEKNLSCPFPNEDTVSQAPTNRFRFIGLRWWARKDLNLGPTDYESAALTAELRAPRETNALILYWFTEKVSSNKNM